MKGRQISANRLKEARTSAQLTQADVAFRLRASGLKTTERNVRRWETGETTPHSSVVMPLADALGVTADELFESSSDQDEDSAAVMLEAAFQLNKLGQYGLADELLDIARRTGGASGRQRQMDAADRSAARQILDAAARRLSA